MQQVSIKIHGFFFRLYQSWDRSYSFGDEIETISIIPASLGIIVLGNMYLMIKVKTMNILEIFLKTLLAPNSVRNIFADPPVHIFC